MQFAWALTSGGFRIVSDTLVGKYFGCVKIFPLVGIQGGAGPGTGFLHFSGISEKVKD